MRNGGEALSHSPPPLSLRHAAPSYLMGTPDCLMSVTVKTEKTTPCSSDLVSSWTHRRPLPPICILSPAGEKNSIQVTSRLTGNSWSCVPSDANMAAATLKLHMKLHAELQARSREEDEPRSSAETPVTGLLMVLVNRRIGSVLNIEPWSTFKMLKPRLQYWTHWGIQTKTRLRGEGKEHWGNTRENQAWNWLTGVAMTGFSRGHVQRQIRNQDTLMTGCHCPSPVGDKRIEKIFSPYCKIVKL